MRHFTELLLAIKMQNFSCMFTWDKVHWHNWKQGAENWHFSILVMHNLTCLSSLSFLFNRASINTKQKTNMLPIHTSYNNIIQYEAFILLQMSRLTVVLGSCSSQLYFPKWTTGATVSINNKYTTLHIDPRANITRYTNIKCGGSDLN